MSVIPTAALVLIGTAVGDTLRRDAWKPLGKIAVLLAFSGALMLSGWVWHFSLPFNKPVWTASYILFTAGLSGLILTLLYAAIDVMRLRWLVFPLVVYGSNAIAAYVGAYSHQSLDPAGVDLEDAGRGAGRRWNRRCCTRRRPNYGPYRGGWVYTLGYLLIVWLALSELYRRKLFLRV